MFKPHFSDATATIIIEGLAVARYNTVESKWKTLFLRNCDHYPRVTIREVNRTTGQVISSSGPFDIAEDEAITISDSSSSLTDYEFSQGGQFDKQNAHSQDIRWMLNIDQMSGRNVPYKTNPTPTNLLTISGGCFYTSVLTKEQFKDRKIFTNGTVTPFQNIGITGRTFGCDFRGGTITIEFQQQVNFNQTITPNPATRTEIIFDNTCSDVHQPQPNETDFHNYYKLFVDSPDRIDLQVDETAPVNNPPDIESEQEPKEPPCHAIRGNNEP